MTSKVMRLAYNQKHLVGITDHGSRVLYHSDSANPRPWASLKPFEEREIDSKRGVIVWREHDDETPDDFRTWIDPRRDGLEWVHPEYEG